MEISTLAGNAYFPKEESCHKKGISKRQLFGKGTYDHPASIQEAVATTPKRKSSLDAAPLREASRKISNPDTGDGDE